MTVWGYLGNKFFSATKTMLNFGNSTRTKIGQQLNSLLERLGFNPPRNREEKLELLNEVKEQVEKEIEKIEHQDEIAELLSQLGLKKFHIPL